jgi:hypothetical protein
MFPLGPAGSKCLLRGANGAALKPTVGLINSVHHIPSVLNGSPIKPKHLHLPIHLLAPGSPDPMIPLWTNPETDDLFTGRVPILEALKKLRLRLLDLTRHNRLLNFKHSPGKCIQFVGATTPTNQLKIQSAHSTLLQVAVQRFLRIPPLHQIYFSTLHSSRTAGDVCIGRQVSLHWILTKCALAARL